jgi:hypothetical protein
MQQLNEKTTARFNVQDIANHSYTVSIMKIINGWRVVDVVETEATKKLDEMSDEEYEALMAEEDRILPSNLMKIISDFVYPEEATPPFRELLQNSVDANATHIYCQLVSDEITIKNVTANRLSSGFIFDDASGMSLRTIKTYFLKPTFSSKRETLYLDKKMIVMRKVVEQAGIPAKIGVFGIGVFAFFGLMQHVFVITKLAEEQFYHFMYIDTPSFMNSLTNPPYDKMIIDIPIDIESPEQLTEFFTKSKAPYTKPVRTKFVELFEQIKSITHGSFSHGTLVYGDTPDYEKRDTILREPDKFVKIIQYNAECIRFLRPKILITLETIDQGDRTIKKIDPSEQLNRLQTEGINITIRDTQVVEYAGQNIELDRELEIWAIDAPKLPDLQIIIGGLPLEINIGWFEGTTEAVGKFRAITRVGDFSYRDKDLHWQLDEALGYKYLINCYWLDLNIGRDKILQDESYAQFKKMFLQGILQINDRLFPESREISEPTIETLSNEFLERLMAYYVHNSRIKKNKKFQTLLGRIRTHNLFNLYFGIEGHLSISIEKLLKFHTIYIIPPIDKDKISRDVHNKLRRLFEATGCIILDFNKTKYFSMWFTILNAISKEITKLGIKVIWLNLLDTKPAPTDLNFEITSMTTITYEDIAKEVVQPTKIIEPKNITNIVDQKVVKVCQELIDYLFNYFKELYKNVEPKLKGLILRGEIVQHPEFQLTPEERTEVDQFFAMPGIIVKMTEMDPKVMARYIPPLFNDLPYVAINKKCGNYSTMADFLQAKAELLVELLAYLSSLLAHELAHAKPIKYLCRFILQQDEWHREADFVNAREVCQDLSAQFLSDKIEELRKKGVKGVPMEGLAVTIKDLYPHKKVYCKKHSKLNVIPQVRVELIWNEARQVWICPIDKEVRTPSNTFIIRELATQFSKRLVP